jgi:hypothetical protein
VYPKVSGLSADSSQPLGAVVSLLYESTYGVFPPQPFVSLLNVCIYFCKHIFCYRISPDTFLNTPSYIAIRLVVVLRGAVKEDEMQR